MTELVWYAAYGSNLLRNRFLCYIQGGTPPGAAKYFSGCTDKSLPKDDKPITIPHRLYFSKQSAIWEHLGVAFITAKEDPKYATLGRRYLINQKQFIEVVRQENACDVGDSSIQINMAELVKAGQAVIAGGWYSRLLWLGSDHGIPIVTFTGAWEDDAVILTKPGENYLRVIAQGLKETYNLPKNKIIEYLQSTDGIYGLIDKLELKSILSNSLS
jgi:hypothetical protein